MIKNITLSSLSFLLLLSLCGCAAYKARPLGHLADAGSLEKDKISFTSKAFNLRECKKYLDRDVLKQGYQPVHISITNNTNRHVYFTLANISLPTVDAIDVAQLVHTNTAGRAAGYGVVGLFIWPLLIPAVVDGIGSSKANEQLDNDFDKKALKNQPINPFQTINGLIFVPKESYCDNYQIQLVDKENEEPIILNSLNPFLKTD